METTLLRLYRGLLVFYPAEFRDEYARELCLALVDRCREERSRLGLLAVWIHAAFGILAEAPKEHYHLMMQDIRHAIRVMRKDAPITAAAIAILALGIGSTTAVFTLVNGILVRPLPYPEHDRLVKVEEFQPPHEDFDGDIAFPNYLDIRTRMRLLDDVGVFTEGEPTIRGEGDAERVPGATISDGVFRVLGVKPLLGRLFTREEDVPKGASVVVLGEELWRRRYGADPGILGRTIGIGSTRRTVIGVMPSSFHFPERAELWLPLQISRKDSPRTDHYLQGIARLKSGVSVEQATAELESLMRQINKENPTTDYGNLVRAIPIRTAVAGEYRPAVITLLAAVGFLLLIACANITNLLLIKASVRTREMAVRTALGASRARLIRQLITESALFGLVGGVAGIALAYAGVPALLSLIPIDLPRWMTFSIDGRVLGFALLVSLATSLIFGVVPAFGSSRVELSGTLKEGGRTGTAGARRSLLRNGLVVAEVALSLTLLAGAGLMVRSFLQLRHQPMGFAAAEKILTLNLGWPGDRYPRGPKARALQTNIERELSGLPGVSSVALASGVPLASVWGRSLTVEGFPLLSLKDAPSIFYSVASPAYFRTLGIPIVEGRNFMADDWDHPLVTIVDESLAKQYWPNESAIGKRVRYGPPENNEPWHTIVGVAGNVRTENLSARNRWNIYVPFSPFFTAQSVMIRTRQDPMRLAEAVRKRIVGIDRDIAVSQVFSLEQIVDRAAWRERFFTVLFAVFSALAVVLAAVGLYGVLAYAVSLRTHEIGIRMALGASARQVQGMVLRQGLLLTGLGLFCGIAAALALTRLMATQLYHVSPSDPATFAAVTAILMIVAAVAAVIPARRATLVDPVVALREE
ncbi:MAG TPA: ABC transporter permease [Bryobacteraceae bacterium]|nr:ABC transporter permease [Bryobacteraceae bacterium]